jgi:hypothetical protein
MRALTLVPICAFFSFLSFLFKNIYNLFFTKF